MLDDRVREVLARLEAEEDVPSVVRVSQETGRFLFSVVAPQTDCEVLEVGAGKGYSTLWLAAGVRYLGGRVVSLEKDPEAAEAWRRNIADAGLDLEWAELIEGDALETLASIQDIFDVIFLDGAEEEYERYFQLARERVEPAALVMADNVLSHEEILGGYVRARQEDPTLLTVTVPIGRGVEMTIVLSESL